MDWVVSNATATVIAFSNGRASIYLSTGGGFIGGGESHESVRNAAKKMVAVAVECQPHTHATSEYSLPQKQDEIVFYLLTDAGIFTATASKEDLSSHHRPLSKLHDAAQGIITEYRLIEGKK
jgi:ribosomal protein L30E